MIILCRATLVALILGVSAIAPAYAQEKTGLKPGFVLAPGTARIVLMRPSIRVGAQSTGGMYEPNADWTDQAKENIATALAKAQTGLGNSVVGYVDPVGAGSAKVTEYQELFGAVASSVIEYQFFKGNRLPTKKRKDQFEWGLGPDVRALPGLDKADYALFITTEDHFGSTGRKVLQVFAAMARVGVTAGVHKGFAGLVDLRTGELVWLNADMQMGGDVRDAEGADKRVRQLLEGFPGKPAEAPVAVTTVAAAPAVASAH
ncbi:MULTISPECIES: hypothetical protein [unclassified Sphingomonas]|uniref:hypothetical protein n=1 Tax=unclassified Sphingomonas TaxID=196159 RepID=UPI000E71D249|nr:MULTISPECIES: hypothetical protein [unclassified Sphingomonas]RKE53642.1 hypothetical protein C8J39_0792 [Sphingomonas sp. PP-CC-1A-547]TCM10136.1 hypothetical protein C8J41_101648 [Sphingomonas sp. PP-CC-3G-468]